MSDIISFHEGFDAALQVLRTHRAILVLDQVGCIVAINRSYLRLTGFERQDLIGRPVWLLLDHAERCAGRLGDLLDLPPCGAAHLPELAHVTKSGRRFRVDARVIPLDDGTGQARLRMVLAKPEDSGGIVELAHVQNPGRRVPVPSPVRADVTATSGRGACHLRLVTH
ncbi:PAS domain-containing protein [Paracoccus ravus]|uniref:PAS domain-containing protein n=1 Tax=Paracoccus ravus TaxID=2447760 RepID=UPI00106E6451|nr:PAS domain-containing protein [Paracoccus ravus]